MDCKLSCVCIFIILLGATNAIKYRHSYYGKKLPLGVPGTGDGSTVIGPGGPIIGPGGPIIGPGGPIILPGGPIIGPGGPIIVPPGPVIPGSPPVVLPPTCTVIQQCQGAAVFNPTTCQCDCRAVCNSFQRLNTATCTCDNICANAPACPIPLIRNEQTCQCQCPQHTNGNYYLGFRSTCNAFQELNPATCRCECNPRQCAFPFFQDPNTCECACRTSTPCPFGQTRNPANCQCECSRRRNRCSFGQVLNQDTCECECSRRQPCPFPRFLNLDTCQCDCNRQCSGQQVLNLQSCQCECTLVTFTVERTIPGPPGPPAPAPFPPQFIRGISRTPGGRIRSGAFDSLFNFGNGGFFPNNGNGFFFGRKKRAVKDAKRVKRRRSGSPGSGFNFPIQLPIPQVTLPPEPQIVRETRTGTVCPAGTTAGPDCVCR